MCTNVQGLSNGSHTCELSIYSKAPWQALFIVIPEDGQQLPQYGRPRSNTNTPTRSLPATCMNTRHHCLAFISPPPPCQARGKTRNAQTLSHIMKPINATTMHIWLSFVWKHASCDTPTSTTPSVFSSCPSPPPHLEQSKIRPPSSRWMPFTQTHERLGADHDHVHPSRLCGRNTTIPTCHAPTHMLPAYMKNPTIHLPTSNTTKLVYVSLCFLIHTKTLHTYIMSVHAFASILYAVNAVVTAFDCRLYVSVRVRGSVLCGMADIVKYECASRCEQFLYRARALDALTNAHISTESWLMWVTDDKKCIKIERKDTHI